MTLSIQHDLGESIRAITPIVSPLIKQLFERVLDPAIKNFLKSNSSLVLDEEKIRTHFKEYLMRTYARLSYINTLVFPNQQIRLLDVYIPLTVKNRRDGTQYCIEGWSDTFIPVSKRVLITDTAGMGKSTLLKRLFLDTFDCNIKIPIFIELKALSTAKPVLDRIFEDLGTYESEFPKPLLLALLKRGDLVIFFDGYDEIALEHKEAVTRDLQDFVNRNFDNWFVISSRSDPALSCLGEFQAFSIAPLKKAEAYSLLRRYDKEGRHAKALILELDGGKYQQVKDLLHNPMLVSLLFKAYTFKAKVPFKKHIFYRQVFDALFEAHDFTKGESFSRPKHCGLDIEDFHTILRQLGFKTAKLGRIDFPKDRLIELLTEINKSQQDIKFKPADLLLDLVSTVPLFACEGVEYNWAHKSVQDYFTSEFLYRDVRKEQRDILLAIYKSENGARFSNVIDLLHDTDPSLIRHILIRRLLQDFIVEYEHSYLGVFSGVSENQIARRKEQLFGNTIVLTALSVGDNGALGSQKKQMGRALFEKLSALAATTGLAPRKLTFSMIYDGVSRQKTVLATCRFPKPGSFMLGTSCIAQYDVFSPVQQFEPQFDLSLLVPDKPIIVDDDPKNILNQSLSFDNTTAACPPPSPRVLNYAKAKKLLGDIEKEIAEISERDPLIEGI